MNKMVFGVFANSTNAENALNELYKSGLEKDDVSVIVQDNIVKEGVLKDVSTPGTQAAQGAAAGGATGAALGALAGFLIGVGAITIPGLGALLVAGPIATALGLTGAAAAATTGAVGGALAGGFVGALVKLGLPEEKAKVYEQRIKSGDILLVVKADSDEERTTAESVFEKYDAAEINYYTLT